MAAHDALASVMARVTEQWSAAVAARELAVAGVPVFPAIPGGKRPLTEHGFHDATTDVARVESWWRDSPAANIGVATGAASGVVVVDVDVHGPINGTARWAGRGRQAWLTGGCCWSRLRPVAHTRTTGLLPGCGSVRGRRRERGSISAAMAATSWFHRQRSIWEARRCPTG